MPWEVTGPVRERERFIEAYLTGFYTITELAERFGMSRQKLHKWLARHNLDGMKDSSIGRVRLCTFRIERATRWPSRSPRFVADSHIWDRGRSLLDSRSCIRTSSGLRRARPATFFTEQTWCSHANAVRRPHIRCACAASQLNRTT